MRFEDPQRRILVDLAAQTQQSLGKWLDDADVLGLAQEHGLTLTWWHVMDAGRDSVDLLRQWLDQFGGRIKLVIVLNEIRGDRFEILETSGELAQAEALGASVISLRRLPVCRILRYRKSISIVIVLGETLQKCWH